MGRVLVVAGGLGPHMGAGAARDAAAHGLTRAGWEVAGFALWLGEPGTVEGMVRQVGGRVHTVPARGEPMRFGMLSDQTAIVDRTAVREHSTDRLAVVLRRVWALHPRRVLLALGGIRQSDFGRGLYEGLGVVPGPGVGRSHLPAPVTYLAMEPSTVPVAGLRARDWVTRLEVWRGRPVGHYTGELGPALAALGVDARPAAPYLASYLKASAAAAAADWLLAVTPAVGPVGYGGVVPWAAEVARRSGRPTWIATGQLARGYQDVYRLGPVGIYPWLDQVQTARQSERRAVTMVEQAAYRLGVFMGSGAGGASPGLRRRERSVVGDGIRNPAVDGGSRSRSGSADPQST